uniref:Uncharacterized protein n=1 Tax=Arundo donax TaxID=35708 RepID=A0A0A9BX12_ARUDO
MQATRAKGEYSNPGLSYFCLLINCLLS